MKSTYGYSVHTDVDDNGFMHSQTVTAGNVHDSQALGDLSLGDEAAFYANATYSFEQTRDILK